MTDIGELRSLTDEVRSRGVTVHDLDALADPNAGYERWMPVLVDLIDALKEQARRGDVHAHGLAGRADLLATDLQNDRAMLAIRQLRERRIKTVDLTGGSS
jgi:hypothetical protein